MLARIKKYLPWTIRIFIFLLFMVSAIAKLFPVWPLEKQLVDLGISSWCLAPYLARILIAVEIAMGIAILQPHFLKKLVIPSTILLLFVFCVHLSIEMFQHGAMTGNCGCFGQLIPMSPLEAFIKNIVLIILLIYLYKNVNDKEKGQNKFSFLLIIYLASAVLVFVLFPFCPCKGAIPAKQTNNTPDTLKQPVSHTDSTVSVVPVNSDKNASVKKLASKKETVSVEKVEKGPGQSKSRFSEYSAFGNRTVNLDNGKKIICFFAPGCEHCMEAAKQLKLLSKSISLPEVYIFFMNEEVEKIPDFLKESKCNFPYTIIEIPVFWELLGGNADTPGVLFLWNGNEIKFYEGSGNNKFVPDDLKKIL